MVQGRWESAGSDDFNNLAEALEVDGSLLLWWSVEGISLDGVSVGAKGTCCSGTFEVLNSSLEDVGVHRHDWLVW